MTADPYATMAVHYDRWFGPPSTGMLRLLRDLAGDGPCLEVGVGTGRVALPLAATGLPVVGVDRSTAMLEECRRRREGQPLRLVQADASAEGFDLGERFPLVYSVCSALFDVVGASRVRMIQALARHLTPRGCVVVEAFVPRLDLFAGTSKAGLVHDEGTAVILDLTLHDSAEQRFDNRRLVVGAGGCRSHRMARYYLWPAELDLLAGAAGLRLQRRTAGWEGEPFASGTGTQVAVYACEPAAPATEEPA